MIPEEFIKNHANNLQNGQIQLRNTPLMHGSNQIGFSRGPISVALPPSPQFAPRDFQRINCFYNETFPPSSSQQIPVINADFRNAGTVQTNPFNNYGERIEAFGIPIYFLPQSDSKPKRLSKTASGVQTKRQTQLECSEENVPLLPSYGRKDRRHLRAHIRGRHSRTFYRRRVNPNLHIRSSYKRRLGRRESSVSTLSDESLWSDDYYDNSANEELYFPFLRRRYDIYQVEPPRRSSASKENDNPQDPNISQPVESPVIISGADDVTRESARRSSVTSEVSPRISFPSSVDERKSIRRLSDPMKEHHDNNHIRFDQASNRDTLPSNIQNKNDPSKLGDEMQEQSDKTQKRIDGLEKKINNFRNCICPKSISSAKENEKSTQTGFNTVTTQHIALLPADQFKPCKCKDTKRQTSANPLSTKTGSHRKSSMRPTINPKEEKYVPLGRKASKVNYIKGCRCGDNFREDEIWD